MEYINLGKNYSFVIIFKAVKEVDEYQKKCFLVVLVFIQHCCSNIAAVYAQKTLLCLNNSRQDKHISNIKNGNSGYGNYSLG